MLKYQCVCGMNYSVFRIQNIKLYSLTLLATENHLHYCPILVTSKSQANTKS